MQLGFNRTMTTTGWMASLVLVAFAWPFFWVPAVMKSLHDVSACPLVFDSHNSLYTVSDLWGCLQ